MKNTPVVVVILAAIVSAIPLILGIFCGLVVGSFEDGFKGTYNYFKN